MRGSKPEEEQTEFNSAIATLRRIDAVKKYLDLAELEEDYFQQYRCLKVFFFELVSIMDIEDDKKQRENFRKVRELYWEERKRIDQTISRKFIDALEDWEFELKEKEQEYGMNMPKKQDPRYALSNR